MKIWLYSVDLNMLIIYYILNLFLSEQLTINKYALLHCTNTKILMYCIVYCIYLQYTPSVRYLLHTLFWYGQTYMTFPLPVYLLYLLLIFTYFTTPNAVQMPVWYTFTKKLPKFTMTHFLRP